MMKAFFNTWKMDMYLPEPALEPQREVISEIVFNTSMTGYLEVLTDPSYAGQAVCNDLSADRQLRYLL